MYDYGFRQLDPQLGRWHVVDALAEKYYSISPYAYAGNNPINNIDVAGLSYHSFLEKENENGNGNFINWSAWNAFSNPFLTGQYEAGPSNEELIKRKKDKKRKTDIQNGYDNGEIVTYVGDAAINWFTKNVLGYSIEVGDVETRFNKNDQVPYEIDFLEGDQLLPNWHSLNMKQRMLKQD